METTESDIYFLRESLNFSTTPTHLLIDNSTYCYSADLKGYIKCFLDYNYGPKPNRTFFDGADYCLQNNVTYILCNPALPDMYQVHEIIIWLLSLCYGLTSLIALVGNALVIYVVMVSRRLQTVTNFYIANLAFADVILAIFCIPFQFWAALMQRWDLPIFMCQFCPFIQTLSLNVSVWTLVAICVDRYNAIMTPLATKPRKYIARLVIAGIWIFGAATAIPTGLAHSYDKVLDPVAGGLKPFCSIRWASHQGEPTQEDLYWYLVFQVYCGALVVVQYFIPLAIITFAYIRMGLKLWGTKTPGHCGQAHTGRDNKILLNKKRVIKMLLLVVVVFTVCWLPWQSYLLIAVVYPPINQFKFINIIFFVFHWLAMSNSCYNPFIYGVYSEKFKREFSVRLSCLRCQSQEEVSQSPTDSDVGYNRERDSVRLPEHLSTRNSVRLPGHLSARERAQGVRQQKNREQPTSATVT